jgi:hypothetical protein
LAAKPPSKVLRGPIIPAGKSEYYISHALQMEMKRDRGSNSRPYTGGTSSNSSWNVPNNLSNMHNVPPSGGSAKTDV